MTEPETPSDTAASRAPDAAADELQITPPAADVAAPAQPAKKRPRRWRRVLGWTLGASAVGVVGLWIAVHRVPWLGPALAEGARKVLGPGAVAWMEDTAYAIEDRINQWRYGSGPPKVLWASSSARPVVALPPPPAEPGKPPPTFPPPPFTPPFQDVAAEGDGSWFALDDGRAAEPGGALGPMVKALVHPDSKRKYAAVAVVAIDLSRMELKLVAGVQEPLSHAVPDAHRVGLVAKDDLPRLVAAFNGGFRAVHGQYGMKLGADVFLPPRDIACTVALLAAPARPVEIGTWKTLKARDAELAAYRQTPPCLVEGGTPNPNLSEYARGWGATVSGETLIRRSAIGVDEKGTTLFFGMGDALSAQSLGVAMKAAGARDAAQLDVNYSYPRFLLYADGKAAGDPPEAIASLIADVKFRRGEYAQEPALRDFFYLVRKR